MKGKIHISPHLCIVNVLYRINDLFNAKSGTCSINIILFMNNGNSY